MQGVRTGRGPETAHRTDGATETAAGRRPERRDYAGDCAGEEKAQDAGAMAYDEKVARASARR